mgnify:CR=1 FL=1
MPASRPKILTVVTVPTGGWVIPIQISAATEYDTTVNATIAAGDYFVSWDWQSDDFVRAVATSFTAAVQGAGGAFANALVVSWVTAALKIRIRFEDDTALTGVPKRSVKIRWTQNNGPNIAAVLGFDSSADDAKTAEDNPSFLSDWQHAYGWYSDEDGQLESLDPEDVPVALVSQDVHPAGAVKTQRQALRYRASMSLAYLSRGITWSGGIGYGVASVWPRDGSAGYERNAALECWWREASHGKRFRIYRDGTMAVLPADMNATATASSTTTLTDSAKAWDTDPPRWVGRLLYLPTYSLTDSPIRALISSHTATVLTFNTLPVAPLTYDAGTYQIWDQPYQTYVLDMSDAKEFSCAELPGIDKYNFGCKLLRYTA